MKELRNKPETIPSAEKPQVPNKMELIENYPHKDSLKTLLKLKPK